MTKSEAIDKVLRVLTSRMAMMSKPMREEAYALSLEYQLTASDLLRRMEERSKNV